ncbi:Arginine transport ATP-binding protein ArtM [Leclercia adecarboxylata]|uniref:Arginine transport ATP-binding protein ArtM n=1 Tax=Leclercia adecarboxylata TaxID=83655 RepID=A0A4U9HZ90_9ENTR|nr:Arginine transport ATP-binding protein ArtM [Leclercia adecarboxylata]
MVAIIGPSGSGKTTLLRSINLLEHPEGGTIRVGEITIDTGKSLSQQKGLIRRLRQHVGFVFQSFNLFPPSHGAGKHYWKGQSLSKASRRMKPPPAPRELLAKVGLSGKESSYPRRLSGGPAAACGHCPARWPCVLT